MYCMDFEYANEKLSDYGMIVCSFNGSGGAETVSSGADITFSQSKPSMGNRFNLYSSSYEEPFTATFQICKNPRMAKSFDEMCISTAESSAVQRWLCRKNKYHKFKLFQDGYEHIYWNATFSSKQVNVDGRQVGFEVTVCTDAPYAYMDKIEIEKDCSEILEFDIYDSSDEVGHISPDMEILFLEDGDFTLENSMDYRKPTRISGCRSGEKIKIDGKNQIITTSLSTHLLHSNFNYVFPKIFNTYDDNKNTFNCSLKCNLVLSYSPIRKVGI